MSIIGQKEGEKLSENFKKDIKRPSEEELSEILNDYVEEALSQNVLSFNGKTLKKKFPKTWEQLKKYAVKRAGHDQFDNDNSLEGILVYTAVMILYSFFDENGVYINIQGLKGEWFATIQADTFSHTSSTSASRVRSEHLAFTKAFELYENTL